MGGKLGWVVLWMTMLSVTPPAAHATKSKHPEIPASVHAELSEVELRELAGRLSSPLPGADVSSEFGGRRHPTLHRARFHGGLDFGASHGTHVLAAGDGVVEKIVRTRGHGLLVVIRHSGRLQSGYAHLHRTRPGLEEGDAVRAQEVIGEVGSSGRASGPHLHFEVSVDGVRVDPRLALAPAVPRFGPMPRLAGALGTL